MSLNILITGSSGFLGSQLCKNLSSTEHKIIAVDIKNPQYKYDNVQYFRNSLEIFIKENSVILSELDLM